MSNYYSQVCMSVPLQDVHDVAALLADLNVDDDTEAPGVEAEVVDDAVWISGNEVNGDALAAVLRRHGVFCTFEVAHTSDRPQLDSFGGSVYVVTADGVYGSGTSQLGRFLRQCIDMGFGTDDESVNGGDLTELVDQTFFGEAT